MDSLSALHLIFIALWGGVLACEALLEFIPVRTRDEARLAASLHFRIDTVLEAPLLAAIALTGVLLLRDASWTALLTVKVAGAAAVLGANAACIAVVVRRHRSLAEAGDTWNDTFSAETRRIHALIYAFTPVGLGVFALGTALA